MKWSTRRAVLVKALELSDVDEEFKNSVLLGFRKAYIESGEGKGKTIRIDPITRYRINRGKVSKSIVASRAYVLNKNYEEAGVELGRALYYLYLLAIGPNYNPKVDDEEVLEYVKSLKVRCESVDHRLFPSIFPTLLEKIDYKDHTTVLNGLICLTKFTVESLYRRGDHKPFLIEYERAKRFQKFVIFPLYFITSTVLLIVAIIVGSVILAITAPFIATIVFRFNRKYEALRRILDWHGVKV